MIYLERNPLPKFFEPFKLAEGSFVIVHCKNSDSFTYFSYLVQGLPKKINEKDENVLYNRKSYDLS